MLPIPKPITRFAKQLLGRVGYDIIPLSEPIPAFRSDFYQRHTARRLEHLASLRIPLEGMSVLEVGAGIGEHSHYFLDRDCALTITEIRPENLAYLRRRYPDQRILSLDLEAPHDLEGAPFDVVHCYGLLYHLSNPAEAIDYLSANAGKLLLLETCVSFGEDEVINRISEVRQNLVQANSGTGCRPTRSWVFNQLKRHFEHVYIPRTQPRHEHFAVDWTAPEKHSAELQRAVFIASREPLDNALLSDTLLATQTRHA